MVGPSETGESEFIYNWLQIGTRDPKSGKISFFYPHSQPFYVVMQKEIENLEFVQGINFDLMDSLINNNTIYLSSFDKSCEANCNSKLFVAIATAGRYRRMSTNYIKQNLFHQSKFGRDGELQNTHIVLFEAPHDVMQVSTNCA